MKANSHSYYTEEQVRWLKDNIDKYPTMLDLTNAYNNKFEIKRTYGAIRDKCSNLKIKSNYQFTKEQDDWLNKNFYDGVNRKKLLTIFNNTFHTEHTLCSLNTHLGRLNLLYNNNYNKEEEEWLLNNISKYKNMLDLSNEYNKIFERKRSYCSIRNKCSILKVRSSGTYIQEQINWIKENYNKYDDFHQLCVRLNKLFNSFHTYNSVRNQCFKLNLQSNKPKSLPIGTERLYKTRLAYPQETLVKITHNEWVSKARYVNGLSKKDKDKVAIVINNKKPITKENTLVLTKKGHQYMLGNHYYKLPPRLKPLAAKNCELKALLKGEK